jgi:hypothetical protein
MSFFCNKNHSLSSSQNTLFMQTAENTPEYFFGYRTSPSVCSLIGALCLSVGQKAIHLSVSQNSLCMRGQDHLYLVFLYTIMYMSVCLFVRTLGMSVGQNTLGNCLSRKQRRQVAISRYSCWGGVEGAPNPNPI